MNNPVISEIKDNPQLPKEIAEIVPKFNEMLVEEVKENIIDVVPEINEILVEERKESEPEERIEVDDAILEERFTNYVKNGKTTISKNPNGCRIYIMYIRDVRTGKICIYIGLEASEYC